MSISIDVFEVSNTEIKPKDIIVIERDKERHTCYVVLVSEDMVYTNCGWFEYSEIVTTGRIKIKEETNEQKPIHLRNQP